MKVLLISLSFILVAQCRGGVLLHNIRDSLHSKIYGHGLHGENNNSPVININNYQNVNQQSTLGTAGGGGGQQSTHHNRGDWNSNRGDGYSNHHSMKQESYPSKFGQHHNSNRFGNNKIGSLSSSSAAAASQFGGSASTASSSSSVVGSGFRGSSSTSSSSSSSSSSVNGYRKDPYYNNPWRY